MSKKNNKYVRALKDFTYNKQFIKAGQSIHMAYEDFKYHLDKGYIELIQGKEEEKSTSTNISSIANGASIEKHQQSDKKFLGIKWPLGKESIEQNSESPETISIMNGFNELSSLIQTNQRLVDEKFSDIGYEQDELKDKIDTISKETVKIINLNEDIKVIKDQNFSISKSIHQIKENSDHVPQLLRNQLTNINSALETHIGSIVNNSMLRMELRNSNDNIRSNFENSLKQHVTPITNSISSMDSKVTDLPKKITSTISDQFDNLESATRSLKHSVEETKEALESLQGKTNILDDLKSKLDKVNITPKLNPFNHEDDVIIELAEQGQLILEQLTQASRHYIAQRQTIKQLESENILLRQDQEQIVETTNKATEQRVKSEMTRQFVKQLTDAFHCLDDVYEDSKLVGVKALIMNYGVVRCDDLFFKQRVVITDETRNANEAHIDFEYAGEGLYEIMESRFVEKEEQKTFRKARAFKVLEVAQADTAIVEETPAEIPSETTSEQEPEAPQDQGDGYAVHQETAAALQSEDTALLQPAESDETAKDKPTVHKEV
jgi:hypothetical protein